MIGVVQILVGYKLPISASDHGFIQKAGWSRLCAMHVVHVGLRREVRSEQGSQSMTIMVTKQNAKNENVIVVV